VFVGGCGKSRVIAALQHFCGALRRWRASAPTGVLLGGSTLHSLLGSQRASQLSTSMRTTASRCTTEALKAVLEVLFDEVSMMPPSMLAEIDKCLRVARWTSLALVAAVVAQGKVLRALAVDAVCRRARLHPQRDDHGAARRRSDADHTTGDGEDSMRALDEAPFRVGQASAASVSKAGAAAQHAHAFRDVEPHRIWLAFLDERHTVWFQSSATHVATLRRMADRAVADPALLTIVAVESGGALPACCAGCARFVDEGAFTVTLMSLLRRERLYRSALGWFGGRPTCAWSRPSCR
jgi:hypothetical protein